MRHLILGATIAAFALAGPAHAAVVVFDDFNTDEGHFNLDPNFSGSSLNDDASSTADRVTTDSPLEGDGHQQLVLNYIDNADSGTSLVIRHLSGSGSAANNTSFTTTSGTDGWIGFFIKTTSPGWTAQLWLEGAENNGGVPKAVINDGHWHAYEWNLDDETGGADGWGPIAGILGGDADFQNGSYTIDSIMLRNTTAPASSTLFLDYVVKSDSGSIANLVPEPASLSLLAFGALPLLRRRRA